MCNNCHFNKGTRTADIQRCMDAEAASLAGKLTDAEIRAAMIEAERVGYAWYGKRVPLVVA